jgi:hypothetical protein
MTYVYQRASLNKKVNIIDLIFKDPCIVDDSVEIPTRCSFVMVTEGSTCFERHTAHHQELQAEWDFPT